MVSVESIKEGFPYPTIPKIPGRPTFETISEIHTKLKANASSVQSELGGGTHGLLGLTLQPGTYTVLTGHVFQPPVNPGPVANVPPNQTGPQIANILRHHKDQLNLWRNYNATEQALKQQLISSIDDIYLKGVANRHTGFATVNLLRMLQHLYDTYGDITPTELEENDVKMKTAYDPTLPIETLYDQIEVAVDFADAGKAPYTNAQVLARAYNIVLQTGLFTDACREWRNKPLMDKTWENFKLHFALAHRDLRQQQTTAQQSGFHTANQVLATIHQDTTSAIEELTNATIADRAQYTQIRDDVAALTNSIKLLQMQLEAVTANQTSRKNRNNNTTSYCWTHGRTKNPKHTSATCKNRAEGHKEEATLSNRLGGSNKYCE